MTNKSCSYASASLSTKACARIKWDCHYSISGYFYYWWSSHCTSKRQTYLYLEPSFQFCLLFSFIIYLLFIFFFFGLMLDSQEYVKNIVYFKMDSGDAEEIDGLRAKWDLKVWHTSTRKESIGCKWVYTVKLNPDESLTRLKVRLVTKRY